jgi:TrmH family RNA methyltransferase
VAHRFVTSEQNPDIKRIKALRDRRSVRHTERLCVVEGRRFVFDATLSVQPRLVVLAESTADSETPAAGDVIVVPDALFERVADTETPQGILGVFPFPDLAVDPNVVPLMLVADRIQDPGNLGTMIRSAAALGATVAICGPGTVDPFAPKVIRAAAAAQWLVPIFLSDRPEDAIEGANLTLAEGNGEIELEAVDFRAPTAIVIGGEGRGISDSFRSVAHVSARIPMTGLVESLNAGVAASIALYEARRQRMHPA